MHSTLVRCKLSDLEKISFNKVCIEHVFKCMSSFYQFNSDSEYFIQDKIHADSLKVKDNVNQTMLKEFAEKVVQMNSEKSQISLKYIAVK